MFINVLTFEIKHNIKNIYQYIYIYSFLVATLLVCALTFPDPQALKMLGSLPLWVGLALGVTISANHIFHDDCASGFIEQIQLTSGGLESYIMAKFLALLLMVLVPAMALMPISALLGLGGAHGIAAPFMLSGVSFLACSMMAAAITAGLKKAHVMLQLLVLPWMIPVLIFASHAGEDSLDYLLGLTGFLTPMAFIVCLKTLRSK